VEGVSLNFRVGAEGKLAAATQGREQRSLGDRRRDGGRVRDARDEFRKGSVVGADLDRESTLAGSGKHHIEWERADGEAVKLDCRVCKPAHATLRGRSVRPGNDGFRVQVCTPYGSLDADDPQSDKTGEGENDRVELPFLKLAQPGVEVPADGRRTQVGAGEEELRGPARAAGPDNRAFREKSDWAG